VGFRGLLIEIAVLSGLEVHADRTAT
jgi:hypothetical protein